MKFATSSLRWLLLGFVLLAALGQNLRAQGSFSFRAVHMVAGGPNVDIHFNDMPEATIANLPYEYASTVASNLPVGSGSVNVKAAPAGAGIGGAIVNLDLPVQNGNEYVALAYSVGLTPKIKVLERLRDQLPSGGNALLRVVNLTSVSNPAGFDFYVDSTKNFARFTNIMAEQNSMFISLTGTTKTVYITPTGSKTPFAQVIVPMTPLARVTLIVTGTGTGTDQLKIYALNGENNEMHKLPVLPIQGVQTGVLPSVRVVHAWRQTIVQGTAIQPLDVFVDNEQQPRTTNLKYRVASPKYGPFTGDSVAIRFTPVNEALSVLYSRKFPVARDSDYLMILTKTREGAAAALLLNTPNSLPESAKDSLYVRVAQVSDMNTNITIKIIPQGGTAIEVQNQPFLTASSWYAIPRGMFRVEAYRAGETTPFHTTESAGADAAAYFTAIVVGDASSFNIDLLNEMVPTEQVFDPAASVPVIAGEALGLRNFPNPFAGSTTINFSMPRAGRVAIDLFDPMGRQVASILDETRDAGSQSVSFQASGLPAGVYIYRVNTGEAQAAGRMTVTR